MVNDMLLEQVHEIFKRTGVMQEGHFKFTSGRHSNRYVQCARLFEHPSDSVLICTDVAETFRDKNIDLVVGPALGGIIMAYEISKILGVRNIFAERENGLMTLRRNFEVSSGSRAIVVEDVVTTGNSVREVVDLQRRSGLDVAGVACVVDRSNGKVEFDLPFHAVATMNIESWEPENCHLCKQGLPLTQPGSRKS
jgi:orotate phosphoribosyltransferase